MSTLYPQFFGYTATLLLAISLLVNNDIRFRWTNSFGSIAFVLYGISLHALPVILTNGLLLCINVFYLVKIYRTHEDFDLAEFHSGDQIVKKYYSFHKNDIKKFFPDFTLEENEKELRFVVLRDLAFANIFVAHIADDGSAYVKINYTVPKYRDLKVGRFIFEKEKRYLINKGIKKIVYKSVFNKNHEHFLKVMGFEKTTTGNEECYSKILATGR
jgi:hypothetical protein